MPPAPAVGVFVAAQAVKPPALATPAEEHEQVVLPPELEAAHLLIKMASGVPHYLAGKVPPAVQQQHPSLFSGAARLIPGFELVLAVVAGSFEDVLPALAAAFPASVRPPPLRLMPDNPHPADILQAGFPTVPLAGLSRAFALTVCAEALSVALSAEQGKDPQWIEMLAQVGTRFPRSPAMPWAVAYTCRRDDGGPVCWARAAGCPYWTSPACRVTVYYSSERLEHLGAVVLSLLKDPHHLLEAREGGLRARIPDGCFSAVGLCSLFGRELLAPGLPHDEWRPLLLSLVVMVALRHFAETFALRAAPCDQHCTSMADELVMVTHDLYE